MLYGLVNSILTYGDAADAAARDALDRRLAPALRQMATRLKSVTRRGDVRQLTTVLDAELPKLHVLISTLVETGVRDAVRRAWRAAPARYAQVYGPEHTRRLMHLKAGSADDVVDRILYLPDQFGYTYSQRIWNNLGAMRQELSGFMVRHMREGASLVQEAEALRRWQLDDPQLPRHLRTLEQAGRRLLTDVPGAKADFLTALASAKAYVARLTPGERGIRGFQQRTVQQLTKAVRQGSSAAMDEAVDRFVQRRGRYRAEVLLRSEVNRAYGDGILAEYREHNFVQAVKWLVMPGRQHTDECFPAGTSILCFDGRKKIETITPGTAVLTHLGRFRPVVAVGQRTIQAEALVRLEVQGEARAGKNHRLELTATPCHPVLTADGWRAAGGLQMGERVCIVVQLPGGHDDQYDNMQGVLFQYGTITKRQDIPAQTLTVYNIHVVEDHTYIANNVVVHNCDLKAQADIGLGTGVFYKDHVPFPDHANGRCKLDPVLAPLHESLDALPFEPQNPQQLQEAMAQLTGPLARAANMLGHRTQSTPADYRRLLSQIIRVPPVPSPRPTALPPHLAESIPASILHDTTQRTRLVQTIQSHLEHNEPLRIGDRLLWPTELRQILSYLWQQT